MLELAGVLLVGAIVIATVVLVVGLLKLMFKLLLIPLWLGWAALKLVLIIGLALIALTVLGPLVLGLGLVLLIPLAILAAVIWAGAALVA